MVRSRVYYGIWLVAALLLYLWSDSWIAGFTLIVSLALPVVSGAFLLLERKKIQCFFEIKDVTAKNQKAIGESRFSTSAKAWLSSGLLESVDGREE